ncbi:bacterial extracellular solute-binding family protein [Bordetella holmesii ATCC 51541]|nr:bacterial extracellular solute-binding family protein [Bordetella holmesii ATCC 51541]
MALTLGVAADASFADGRALTVYTAGPGTLIKQLADGFTKQTGVRVDVFQATTGKVMARLEAEAANPRVDVLISASWDTALDMDARGMLLPYDGPNAARVPAAYRGKTYVAQGISALGIVWNSTSNTPEPKDWADLANPAYKDAVTMPDPALSGATLDLLLGLQSAQGAGVWTLLEKLRANGMAVSGPNAQALTPVLQGARAAVFGGVDYVAYASVQKGEHIKVIFPTSGTVLAPRPMMVMRSSKSPDQARAFLDYVLSEEGQAAVAHAWLIPAREDVAARHPLLRDLHVLQSESGQTAGGERRPLPALPRFSASTDRKRSARRGARCALMKSLALLATTTLVALLVLVALPVSFVVLQAVFPHLGEGSFAAPFSTWRQVLTQPGTLSLLGQTVSLGVGVAAVAALLGIRWAPCVACAACRRHASGT